jgi:YebC/PmpR family DNA-binding regulatory protein
MSGHSKWATIKRKKGAADAKRGQLFSKLSRAIIVAAKEGGGDPDANAALANAIQKARDNSMPKDNIERAIQRGAGTGDDAVQMEEIVYEGYGPHGVAIVLTVVTDNKNRTLADIKYVLNRTGGNLATSGAVTWQFTQKGYIEIERKGVDYDEVFMTAAEAGADDVQDEDDSLVIYTPREELGAEFFEGSGLGIKPISAFGTKRLMRFALRYALERGRRSVTIVHKGNIQKFTEGAFRNWCYEVAREEFAEQTITEDELWEKYDGQAPDGKIVIKDRIADIMFQHMLLRPKEFDIVVAPNLNGDYLSDAIAAEVGGVGIAPGANIGDKVALFEATHGTAPKYTDQDKVNPGSLMFSGVNMLEWLGWWEAAELINSAYEKTLDQKIVTYDFARQMANANEVGTSAFATALIRNMSA